jgi:hypothetical protein
MNHLERLQDLLPPPYSVAADSILTQLLNLMALEMEIFQEDLDRVRQSHWIRFVYQLADAEKLAALLGIKRLAWETLPVFRERLLALVTARLQGALGPNEIKQFVYDYLANCERVLNCSFVPGLQTVTLDQAYKPPAERPQFRPLRLVENPIRMKRSPTLLARRGGVPYLYRWRESNHGQTDTFARFTITGLEGGRTAVPMIANLTTGEMFGYSGTLSFGQTLEFTVPDTPGSQNPRAAAATINRNDVSDRVFSMSRFTLGLPFTREQLDAKPLLPRMVRGANDWLYLSAGFYGMNGLDHFFFSLGGPKLREGVFDQTFFDASVFPSGTVAHVTMEWTETEPASFEVHVPRYLTTVPSDLDAAMDALAYLQVGDGLRESIGELHAAGVRAEVVFDPFLETQQQKVRGQLSWVVLDPEQGPAGLDRFSIGGRFGDSPLGGSRFS